MARRKKKDNYVYNMDLFSFSNVPIDKGFTHLSSKLDKKNEKLSKEEIIKRYINYLLSGATYGVGLTGNPLITNGYINLDLLNVSFVYRYSMLKELEKMGYFRYFEVRGRPPSIIKKEIDIMVDKIYNDMISKGEIDLNNKSLSIEDIKESIHNNIINNILKENKKRIVIKIFFGSKSSIGSSNIYFNLHLVKDRGYYFYVSDYYNWKSRVAQNLLYIGGYDFIKIDYIKLRNDILHNKDIINKAMQWYADSMRLHEKYLHSKLSENIRRRSKSYFSHYNK